MSSFLCPRCRAGCCELRRRQAVGQLRDPFLCPRCRAGCCELQAFNAFLRFSAFLCPRCRAGCCEQQQHGPSRPPVRVSMPSMSGWVLRGRGEKEGVGVQSFLCPRCRAGCCEPKLVVMLLLIGVSMPSMSGWVLRGSSYRRPSRGRGNVSMPSMSGWVLRELFLGAAAERGRFYALDVGLGVARARCSSALSLRHGFYALDVGLGVARRGYQEGAGLAWFLCPRCRAGCCEAQSVGQPKYANRFYALDVGLGVASALASAGAAECRHCFYALDVGLGVARQGQRHPAARRVSMPSMSGWVLRVRANPANLVLFFTFLCPRCRAGCCEEALGRKPGLERCFYALDVGLGVAS